MQVHEGNCRYLPQSCPNSCGESFSGEELKKHLELDCHKRKVECGHCADKMAYDELQVNTFFGVLFTEITFKSLNSAESP